MKLHWTEHAQIKMRQYGLSKGKLMALLRKPERKEEGIAPGTTAVMMSNKKQGTRDKTQIGKTWFKQAPGEIWLMYKDTTDFRKIISAWRYPGISKPGESIPIPEEIRQELLNS